MPRFSEMARLTNVYRTEEISYVKIGRRQLPLIAGHNLMMLMDLNSKGLVIDYPLVRGRELDEFTRKYRILTFDELKASLEVNSADLIPILSQTVQCVGCRRSVERLLYQLMLSGHRTLDPIVIKNNGVISISEEKMKSPQFVCTLLHKHNTTLSNLLENQVKNKKSTRCTLHSLDSFRSKPFSETWREVWSSMKQKCREELAVIEAKELQEILENYLRKHKFCQDCRTKVEKAYSLLINDSSSSKEKGFISALYSNIKRCLADKHIHLQTKADFIESLIKRAEPEISGNITRQRERHAKTLEIAQEEVLTCVGMCIYERLRRIYISLREEERACQVLAAVSVHALSRSFDISVEKKQGISNLELLYKELNRAEKAKEFKKEQKKLKKKKRKNEKKSKENFESCTQHNGVIVSEVAGDLSTLINCTCENSTDSCTKFIDGGYGSQPSQMNSRTVSLTNSLEGSEVSCSDDFCNHEPSSSACDLSFSNENYSLNTSNLDGHNCDHYERPCLTLSLQQMLDGLEISTEKEGECYIPDEVVLEFKVRESKIKQLREELRANLRQNFAQMCKKTRMAIHNCND